MENKFAKWYAMTLHVIAYRSKELLFGTHAFNFNCFLDDLNCVYSYKLSMRIMLTKFDVPIKEKKCLW